MLFNLDDLTFEPNPAPFVPVTDDFDNVQSDEFYEPTPDEEAEISAAFGNAFAHEDEDEEYDFDGFKHDWRAGHEPEETTYDDDEEMMDYNSDEPWDGFNSDAEADAVDAASQMGIGVEYGYYGDDCSEW